MLNDRGLDATDSASQNGKYCLLLPQPLPNVPKSPNLHHALFLVPGIPLLGTVTLPAVSAGLRQGVPLPLTVFWGKTLRSFSEYPSRKMQI